MDWKECVINKIVKDVSKDDSKINSIRNVAKAKIISADFLPIEHSIAKITLLYDALRENLESVALKKGYKIYNHECYTAFIKEILNESEIGDSFDKLRKIRNGINYYGTEVSVDEATSIISELKILINYFQNKYL